MPEYQEPEKNYVRRQVWKRAIEILSSQRQNTSIVSKADLSEYLSYLTSTPELAQIHRDWLAFFDSRVGQRSPQDLKVAYLCGPNPENDLECLIDAGVDPRNVWGVELEGEAFRNAAMAMKQWRGTPLKLFHGDFSEFCARMAKERFDIVYFDACGPLPGLEFEALEVLAGILESSLLEDRAVLITNFAGGIATLNDPKQRKFINAFLKTRAFCDARLRNGPETEYFVAGPHELSIEEQLDVEKYPLVNDKTVSIAYGDFITRFIIRMAGRWAPLRKITHGLSNGLMDASVSKTSRSTLGRFLKKDLIRGFKVTPHELAYGGDNANIEKLMSGSLNSMTEEERRASMINHAVLCLLENNADYRYFRSIHLCKDSKNDTEKLLKKMGIKRNEFLGYSGADFMYFEFLMSYVIDQANFDFLSDSFIGYARSLYASFGFSSGIGPMLKDPEIDIGFCSVEGAIRVAAEWAWAQLTYPNLVNPSAVNRWVYKSKTNNMYLDLLPMDRARYLFDFVPSIELLDQQRDGVSFFRFFLAIEHLLWRKIYSNLDNILDWGSARPDKLTNKDLEWQVDLPQRETVILDSK